MAYGDLKPRTGQRCLYMGSVGTAAAAKREAKQERQARNISGHWQATVLRGPAVLVESTVASGSLTYNGRISKARIRRIIDETIRAAEKGNVISLTLTIQPGSLLK